MEAVRSSVARRLASGAAIAVLAAIPLACSTTPEPANRGEPVGVSKAAATGAAGEVCVTIQRGLGGTVQDAHLADDKPTKNYGESNSLAAGDVGPGHRQALVQWDTSAIPPDATVTQATATLEVLLYGGGAHDVYRVLAPWSEATVTDASFGGAYDPTILGSLPAGSPTSVDLTALAQGWVSGATPNYGVLIDRTTGLTVFSSSEDPHPEVRPLLDVCYVPGPCSGQPDGTSCDDGNACTTGDACTLGFCMGSAVVCPSSGNQCDSAGVCNPSTGACDYAPVPDGTPCNDGSLCSSGDSCVAGACGGAPIDCDDGIACSIDSCNPVSGGCQHDYSNCIPRICGTVDEQVGASVGPSAGATVQLACNTPGNVLKGATTAADGSYCVLLSPAELGCSTTYLTALKSGFTSQIKVSPGDFTIDPFGSVTVDFLISQAQSGLCFSDDVELDQGWTASAPEDGVRWQRKPNSIVSVNNAVGQCVALASDEGTHVCPSPGANACVEQPGAVSNSYDGNFAFWFGNPDLGAYVGNFLGISGECSNDDGGQGIELGGTLTSPLFQVPAGTASLQFRSWWEIESVDPQQFAYDRMVVRVIDQNGVAHDIGTPNPDIDANGGDHEPYSSGGYFRAPVWSLYEYDLSAYAGQVIQVQFSFRTNDGLYNGYRGWLVDDINVVGSGCP